MRTAISVLLSVFLFALPAVAQDTSAPQDANVIGLGLKAGVALPQVSSELSTTFSTHLELSYQFPFAGSRIGLTTSLGYSQPAVSGTGEDTRLPDGTYSFEATQQQFLWDFGLVARLNPHGAIWNLGATIGGRMQAVSTTSNGDASGESFGEHTETGTFFGLLAGAFGEFTLGPGAAFLAIEYGMASQDLKTVGELNVAAVHILAGYRLMFAL